MDTNEITGQAQDFTTQAKEAVQDQTEHLREQAQHWTEVARSRAREMGSNADFYVREYAWTSLLGVALVAGVAGYFLGSSRR